MIQLKSRKLGDGVGVATTGLSHRTLYPMQKYATGSNKQIKLVKTQYNEIYFNGRLISIQKVA